MPPAMPDRFDPTPASSSRRRFLLAALAGGAGLVLPGCQGAPSFSRALPGPDWPGEPAGETPAGDRPPGISRTGSSVRLVRRSAWAAGRPEPALMDPMRPVRFITVHHTAGPVFYATDERGTAERLESVRRYHRSLGWGDIGYHFAVDRAGRVWECRPLRWQGAHVRDHNEGNLGVVAIGNFDQQQPTEVQLQALTGQVRELMRVYRVPASRLRTHQEWAPTACPGRGVQVYMAAARSNGRFA